MSAIISIAGGLFWCCFWGFVTDSIIKNKGYYSNWFWWGFFFGLIAFVVALCQPENKTSTNQPLPVESSKFDKSDAGKAVMPTDDWKCSCGKMNPSYVTTCTCGVQRDDVLTDDSYAQEIGVDLEEEARKKEGERKEYERLRNQAMRFVNCPKCGTKNSNKREICVNCFENLADEKERLKKLYNL